MQQLKHKSVNRQTNQWLPSTLWNKIAATKSLDRKEESCVQVKGGIILAPLVLRQSSKFANTVFPLRSVMVLETMANVVLLYFLFLVGVEMDPAVIRRTGRKALAIAFVGMVLPFLIGVSFSFMLYKESQHMKHDTFVLILGVALSVTAFPVLARVLAELKLLNTEIGRVAMSAALINNMIAWLLLAFASALAEKLLNTEIGRVAMSAALINNMIAWLLLAFASTLAENESMSLPSIWVILSSVAYVIFCIFVTRSKRPCNARPWPSGGLTFR